MRATRALFLILLFGHTTAAFAGSRAAPLCTTRHGGDPLVADTIVLVAGSNVSDRLLEAGVSLWRGCPNYETDFPAFVISNRDDPSVRGKRVIEVGLVRGSSGSVRCGVYSNGRIELYRSAIDNGHPFICGPLAPNLAHELGHVLGLHDSQRDPSCLDHIMANVVPLSLRLREPRDAECRSVGQHWLTLAEIISSRSAVAHAEVAPGTKSRSAEAADPFAGFSSSQKPLP